MEGAFVSVVIYNEITGLKDTDITPSYVICKGIGRVTYLGGGGKQLIDEYTEIDRLFGTQSYGQNFRGSIKLYNLTQGKWWNVYPWVEPYSYPPRKSSYQPTLVANIEFNAFAFEKNPNVKNLNEATWEVGDAYGIEAAPTGSLPRNFQFEKLRDDASAVITITFKPDGTVLFADGFVKIIETQAQQRSNRVNVPKDGAIEYNDKWL